MTREFAPREPQPLSSPEIYRYEDGQTALVYRNPGDVLVLGTGSPIKHARDLYGGDQIFIVTEDGRRYGSGYGLIMDTESSLVAEVPDFPFELEIGKAGYIPGLGPIREVSSVSLKYKYLGLSEGIKKVHGPNEFTALRRTAWDLHQSGFQRRDPSRPIVFFDDFLQI